MSNLIYLILFLITSTMAFSQDLANEFIGVWRSDKEKTLADMRTHPEVSEKARKLFEGDFFGRLINVAKKGQSAAYFIEDKDKPLKFEPYLIKEIGPNYIITVAKNSLLGVEEEQMWYFENPCIYTYITKWNFREYFCKVQ